MTDLYSLLLVAAIAALVVAAGAVLAQRAAGRFQMSAVVLPAATVALALDAASLLVHLRRGHPPGTAEAMSVADFVGEHPAFAVIALLAIGIAAAARRPRR